MLEKGFVVDKAPDLAPYLTEGPFLTPEPFTVHLYSRSDHSSLVDHAPVVAGVGRNDVTASMRQAVATVRHTCQAGARTGNAAARSVALQSFV